MQCPSEPTEGSSDPAGFYTDYFYNERMNGFAGGSATLASFAATSVTIMNGDGPPNNASSYLTDVDQVWTYTAPYASRHLEGSNFAFADGHVKWLKPSRLEPTKGTNPELGNPTFWITTTGN